MNKTKNLKRRYFLTKVRKPRNKNNMNPQENDRLQQFLADVEKFSERNKMRKEGKTLDKQPSLGKASLPNEKRGLFENGMLSKPSVKGILGLKNKARLVGNLENLLSDNASKQELISPSSSEGSKDSPDSVIHSYTRPSTSKEMPEKELPGKLSDWWTSYANMHTEKKQEKKEKVNKGENKSSKRQESGETELVDEAINFAQKRAQQCTKQIHATVKEFEDNYGPITKHINEVQQKILRMVEKSMLKRLMENDPEILKEVQRVQEEFLKFKKPEMVDKCIQTEFNYDISNKTTNKFEKIEFTPDKRENHFVLSVPTTGQPQRNFIPENVTVPTTDQHKGNFIFDNSESVEPPNFFENLPGPSVQNNGKEHLDFLSKDSSNKHLHFLTPPKAPISPFFDKMTPDMQPPILNKHHLAPARNTDKAYFPVILSPLSPGRKYSRSPLFLDEPQWNHFKRPHDMPLKAFRENFKGCMPSDIDTSRTPGEIKTTPGSSFPFPKRLKVTFSPHRL